MNRSESAPVEGNPERNPERERFLDAMQEMAEAFKAGDGERAFAELVRARKLAEEISDPVLKQECLVLVAEVEKVGE